MNCITQIRNDLTVAVDTLGDAILPHHVHERVFGNLFGMAAAGKPFGREIGLATELDDALCDPVSVLLLIVGMLQKFGGDTFRMVA